MIPPDAASVLERLETCSRSARAAAHGAPVELYRRVTLKRRLRLESDGRLSLDEGRDEGTAARVVAPEGGVGFAAMTGSTPESVAALVARATACPGSPSEEVCWARGSGSRIEDLTGAPEPETAEALRDSLRRCLGDRPDRAAAIRFESWIESARTVEAWVADGGLLAVRARSRVWGMTHVPLMLDGHCQERPRSVAAASLEELPSLVALEDDPRAEPRGDLRGFALVLTPPAAAVLVRSLILTQFTPGPWSGNREVSLKIDDAPRDRRGLLGGRFDDAGFPTEPRPVSVGGRWVEPVTTLPVWRASFRDPPRVGPSTVVVQPGPFEAPPRALRITDLRIHLRAARSWMLQVCGRPWVDGALAGGGVERFISVTPDDLAHHLVALDEPPQACPNSVITPSLVLAGGLREA